MTELCSNRELWGIIGVLFVVIVALGAGKGLGALAWPLVKKILGKSEVNVIVGAGGKGEAPSGIAPCLIDPKNCTAHQAEYERSEENKAKIAKLDGEFHQFKDKFFKKLEVIEGGVGEIKIAMAKLTVESNYQQGHRGGTS